MAFGGVHSATTTTATANALVTATLTRFSSTDATTNRTSIYNDSVTSILGAASYQIATSTGAYADAYTPASSNDWSMLITSWKPATATGGSTLHFVHNDHLGGTNVVSSSVGLMEQAIDYYPYGDKRIEAGTDYSQREFIGEEFDETPDLSYLNARYYKNARGQFLSQDPVFWEVGIGPDGQKILLDPQLANSYAYFRRESISNEDSTGRQLQYLPHILGVFDYIMYLFLAHDYRLAVESSPNGKLSPGEQNAVIGNAVESMITSKIPDAGVPAGLIKGRKAEGIASTIVTGASLANDYTPSLSDSTQVYETTPNTYRHAQSIISNSSKNTTPTLSPSSPDYMFQKNSSGNVEIYQNGQRIQTASIDHARSLGYSGY
jgi:RHS repeat-associated protein